MTEHRSREELTEDQARELKIGALEAMPIGAYLLCKRSAELPIGVWGGNYILNLAQCWCPEPHLLDLEGDCPDGKKMRILGDHVWCPVHDNKFNVRQLMDLLQRGKRKSTANRDRLLSKINLNPEPTRYYVFQSGDHFEATGIDTDLDQALAAVQPTPKQSLRGVLIECASRQRAREILNDQADELPWAALALRSDLTLNANWHGCPLNDVEKRVLAEQANETAQQKRGARMKLVEKMRRDADRLVIEPL